MLGYIIISAGLAMIVLSPIIHTIESLTLGVYDMSDAQTQALADLSASVVSVAAAVSAATAEISTLIAANANVQPDDSAAIEAQVAKINAAAAALTAAVPAPVAAPVAAAPAAPVA